MYHWHNYLLLLDGKMRRYYLYAEYEDAKRRYRDAQEQYGAILTEQEKLFEITQPTGIDTEREKVSGGDPKNAFDAYLVLKEQHCIDERLEEVKGLLAERLDLLRRKEEELRASKRIEDRIYVKRFLNGERVSWIAVDVGYSESQVYRILAKISETCEQMRN